MFDRYCLGVDVSVWQSTINWETLYGNGVRFAMIKAAQGSYKQDRLCPVHLKNAQAAGVICGVYHWMDPANKPEDQIINLSASLQDQEFSFLALDVEQYWSDWKEWQNGMISERYSGQLISDRALACATLMRETFQKPVLIYTRASFVKDFAPEMSAWLPDWELWLAHYPYRSGRVRLTWDQLRQNYAPTLPSPSIPKGCQRWRFWQFSGDKFILPGEQTALDLDFYNGSLQDLQAWLEQPVSPRVFSTQEKLDALWQAHPEIWQEVQNAQS